MKNGGNKMCAKRYSANIIHFFSFFKLQNFIKNYVTVICTGAYWGGGGDRPLRLEFFPPQNPGSVGSYL